MLMVMTYITNIIFRYFTRKVWPSHAKKKSELALYSIYVYSCIRTYIQMQFSGKKIKNTHTSGRNIKFYDKN